MAIRTALHTRSMISAKLWAPPEIADRSMRLSRTISRRFMLSCGGTARQSNLGNLGGDGKFAGIYASGLNDDGQVVGTSDTTGDASFHGFLWQQGHITDLGTLTGDSYSSALPSATTAWCWECPSAPASAREPRSGATAPQST